MEIQRSKEVEKRIMTLRLVVLLFVRKGEREREREKGRERERERESILGNYLSKKQSFH
jgi:hypothetical protein